MTHSQLSSWFAAVLALMAEASLPRFSRAQVAQEVTYQRVTLQPGDVINFHGGLATPLIRGPYGHTSMYLGVDPQTRQRVFLDFSTFKEGRQHQAFFGRILPEREFLLHNAGSHETFDVFRLKDASRIDQPLLLQEARRISRENVSWGTMEYCSSAAAKALSKAAGVTIDIDKPGEFARHPLFQKHPQQRSPINIRAALVDAARLQAADARAAQLNQLVPHMAAARRQAVRTELTAEEYAALTEQRRAALRFAKWDYLRTLVAYACSDPGNLRTLNDRGQVPKVTLERDYLETAVNGERDKMSGCEKEVFTKILAADGPASVTSFLEWAATYRSQHGFRVALKKLLDKMKSLGAETESASASVSGTGGGSSSGSSGSASSGSRSSGAPGDSSTLRQLRGVNASGSWPR